MKFLLGLVVGLLIFPAALYLYFHMGRLPVAVADPPFWFERQLVRLPLHARIEKEMPQSAAIEPTDANLEAGAHIYREQCAACHGLNGLPSSFAGHMYPHAPQLWAAHHNRSGVIGVSDDPPGETYWKVSNGIRLTGMPAYGKILSQTQIWQVSMLLSRADKPLPANVQELLKEPLDLDPAAPASRQNAGPNGK